MTSVLCLCHRVETETCWQHLPWHAGWTQTHRGWKQRVRQQRVGACNLGQSGRIPWIGTASILHGWRHRATARELVLLLPSADDARSDTTMRRSAVRRRSGNTVFSERQRSGSLLWAHWCLVFDQAKGSAAAVEVETGQMVTADTRATPELHESTGKQCHGCIGRRGRKRTARAS